MRLGVKKSLYDKVVNNPSRLSSCRSKESTYFEEVGAVRGEGRLEPVDAMQQKRVMLLGRQAHHSKSLKSRTQLLAGLLGAKD